MTINLIQRIAILLLATAVVVALWGDIIIRPSRTNPDKKKGGLIVAGPKDGVNTTPREHKIQLLEGDNIRGTFLGFDPEKGILWRHPAAQTEIHFRNSAVKSILLGKTGTVPKGADEQTCIVQLRTGDEINGKLDEIDDRKLYLDTWYAGKLAIPRDQIRAFSPSVGISAAIYEGPTGTEGWNGRNLRNINQQPNIWAQRGGLRQIPQQNAPGWGYRKNTLVAGGAGSLISRTIKYPDRVRIDFDLQWQGYFQLEVGVMADSTQQYAGNGYVFGISRNTAYLYRHSANEGGRDNIGQHQYQSLLRKTRASFSLLVDKNQKTLTLMIDGVLARQWRETGKFVGYGNLLKFASQGTTPLFLSRIRVLEWDGQMPASAPDRGGELKTDQAYMAKSGNVKGRLIAVKNGQMTFYMDSIEQELNVPLKSVIRTQLAGPAIDPPANDAGLARLHFERGGTLTVALTAWDPGEVTAECDSLGGTVRFLPNAFSRIDLNLDKQSATFDDPFTGGSSFPVPQGRGIPNGLFAPGAIPRR